MSRSPLHPDVATEIVDAIAGAARRIGMAVVVATAEPEPKTLYASRAAADLLGYSLEELLEIPIWKLPVPADLPRLIEMHARQLTGEEVTPVMEARLVRKDGSLVPVEITAQATVVGNAPATVALVTDLSSRKMAQAALAESESRFRLVVESAPDGVAILRGQTIVYLNRAAADMLGYAQAEDAVGHSISEHMVGDDAKLAAKRIERLMRTGGRFSEPSEYRTRALDGREFFAEISSIRIDFEGQPAVLGFARDVTDRKAVQSKLIQADRLAAVGTLAAGVAHEINNPLAYMTLGIDRLARALKELDITPADRAPLLERLGAIRDGADRVATIVRDLKSFSREDDGGVGPVDVQVALENAIRLTENEIRHRARLSRRLEPVPAVRGNQARLEQVFLNLLVNAMQALGEGPGVSHEITVSTRTAGDTHIEVEIADTGSGIPSDILDRIFDPFFTTKAVGVGTGLGLPICRGIVNAFGGELRLESDLGKGTRALVLLPAFAQDAAAKRRRIAPSTSPPPPKRRGRILIIDDEPQVLKALSDYVKHDHDVSIAQSGREALEYLDDATDVDVILCDVMMPDLSGVDVFFRLARKKPEIADRMVFMTGGAFTQQATEFLASTSLPVLNKPFDPKVLGKLLRERIEAASATDDAPSGVASD